MFWQSLGLAALAGGIAVGYQGLRPPATKPPRPRPKPPSFRKRWQASLEQIAALEAQLQKLTDRDAAMSQALQASWEQGEALRSQLQAQAAQIEQLEAELAHCRECYQAAMVLRELDTESQIPSRA